MGAVCVVAAVVGVVVGVEEADKTGEAREAEEAEDIEDRSSVLAAGVRLTTNFDIIEVIALNGLGDCIWLAGRRAEPTPGAGTCMGCLASLGCLGPFSICTVNTAEGDSARNISHGGAGCLRCLGCLDALDV